MGLIAPICAINSWEGYKYQGNVALYVTLSQIKDILLNDDSLDGYEVQIEGEEDFALLKDGRYKSLHQVKLGTIDLDDNDKFAFIAEIIQNGADLGYFHVNTSKSIPRDFLQKACSVISNLTAEFQKPVVSKKDLSEHDNHEDYIVLESVNTNLTAIIYYSKHYGNTKKLLDAIAAADPSVELVDATEKNELGLSRYDKIGFASGIYYNKFAEQVQNFAKVNLPTGKDVFFIATAGNPTKSCFNSIAAVTETA